MYADIIVDISHDELDKAFQYEIPDNLIDKISVGMQVDIPFGKGNRIIKGYIVDISDKPKYDVNLMKSIIDIDSGSVIIESQLINLAWWIKNNYGSTMINALRTVIPVKQKVRHKNKRKIILKVDEVKAQELLNTYIQKNNTARVRLLGELISRGIIDYDIVVNKLNISSVTIKYFETNEIIEIKEEEIYRNPVKVANKKEYTIKLTEGQQKVVDNQIEEYNTGVRKTYLIHGITGSGKTEVYIELISNVVEQGKQAIVLIPEIALTYQTVMRFVGKFGDRVSILNSRLSKGERYDQYLRAKQGEIDIMIGPRSALFTPFNNLGLIVIDEEHEGTYKSETAPKYHTREVAIKRGDMARASVVLGSATPSLEAYTKALSGEYKLYELFDRAKESRLPKVQIVDLREELKSGNKSIISRRLKELIQDRLSKKEQTMIFINKRGYAGFVSCRSCGFVIKCPHCDVSLTSHMGTNGVRVNGRLLCHYCGYEEKMPDVCPTCGSKYIATFGTGTQKVEELLKREFPETKVLRMDVDTTKGKEGHEKILSEFSNNEADILVGTQMIVKGHDFPNVTLVGILAADLSLYANDYRSGERTFQLLTQAAGRAGRGEKEGEVIIQTYNPEHYSIISAGKQDYIEFYQSEMQFRKLLKYPPVSNILVVLIMSDNEKKSETVAQTLYNNIIQQYTNNELVLIGPAHATISKINDIYRRVLYIKHNNYELLIEIKNYLEDFIESSQHFNKCMIQFDFNPMSTY